jgi:hypothetical protein
MQGCAQPPENDSDQTIQTICIVWLRSLYVRVYSRRRRRCFVMSLCRRRRRRVSPL